jgi:hypothetical protein
MKTTPDLYYGEEAEFHAGDRAPAGVYVQLDTFRVVNLDREDTLPATLDGHVAVYIRRASTWAEIRPSYEMAGIGRR